MIRRGVLDSACPTELSTPKTSLLQCESLRRLRNFCAWERRVEHGPDGFTGFGTLDREICERLITLHPSRLTERT